MLKPIQSAIVTLRLGNDTIKRRVVLNGYLSADGSEMLPYVVGDRVDEGEVWEGWRVDEIAEYIGDPLQVFSVRPPNYDGDPLSEYDEGFNAGLEAAAEIVEPFPTAKTPPNLQFAARIRALKDSSLTGTGR